MYSHKVSIVGCGRVGMSAAYAMFLRSTARELVLYDRNIDRIRGEQLDLQNGLVFSGDINVVAAESIDHLKDSDVIVYTAGAAQEPGQTRLDLFQKNKEILESLLPKIMTISPDSVVVIVSNPVDLLTLHANNILSVSRGKVFGTGTSLDTARFRFELSQVLGVNPKNIHTYILGEHGDSSFPTLSSANVGGQPLASVAGISAEQINQAYLDARDTAGTIIEAKGSTYYAIGILINHIVEAVIKDSKRIMPVSTKLEGEYGQHDIAVSVPSVVGKNGVERILEIPLSEKEREKMNSSIEVLKSTYK